jgi:two-component system NtrC family response regulator
LTESTLLIVDDEESILKQLGWAFKDNYKVITASSGEKALELLKSEKPDLMILDLMLNTGAQTLEGFDILDASLKMNPLTKVIVITGHDETENALTAIEKGGYDFFAKPISIDELKVILNRAEHLLSLERQLKKMKEKTSDQFDFEGIISMSTPMLEVFDIIKRVATADVPVLITGESGTGKELTAKAIHNRSNRSEKPFVPINCGAIPENLLESELFGHEKGSFTGAHTSRPGKFEIADGGTIFLDEIAELSPKLQVKLLRFLQDQVIERIGSHKPIQVNIRIIAATNKPLKNLISTSAFREDLYYRINTINIELPPLRSRGDDILLLGMHFLHHYSQEYSKKIMGFGPQAREILLSHSWPGNVRELENQVKRAVIMTTSNLIQPEDLNISLSSSTGEGEKHRADLETSFIPSALTGKSIREAREYIDRLLINRALIRTGGNVSAAAEELEISRPTLHDLINKHGIDPSRFRDLKGKK